MLEAGQGGGEAAGGEQGSTLGWEGGQGPMVEPDFAHQQF